MNIPEGNDVYSGNLAMLKKFTVLWADEHPKRRIYRWILGGGLLLGLAILLYVGEFVVSRRGSQLPIHITLWIIAAILLFLNDRFNKITRPPFSKLHNARFEMSDDGIYYIFQRGMRLCTYYIADADIEEMIYDAEAHVLYLKGPAVIDNIGRDKVERHETVDEIYAMMPFDEYDVDDMLAPYGDMARREPGTLRKKYIDDGSKAPSSMGNM